MYYPRVVPTSPADLPQWLTQELANLQQALAGAQTYTMLATLNAAPERPREGMVVKADGTNWNPGAGAGIYAYVGGAWTKL